MTTLDRSEARLVAVCLSAGGIPKIPANRAEVTGDGIVGDAHAHAKHNRADRAVSLFDREILEQLVAEGFPLTPGAAGENLTVSGLSLQELSPGDELEIGDVLLRLEQPRKPCYVLDAIDPRLKEAIVGRCGYMASVARGGDLRPGMAILVRANSSNEMPLDVLRKGTRPSTASYNRREDVPRGAVTVPLTPAAELAEQQGVLNLDF